MPNLPTITVTQAQSDRILAAYQAKYGTTTTTDTIAAYKAELTKHVVEVVMAYEAEVLRQQAIADRNEHLRTVAASLPAVPGLIEKLPPPPPTDLVDPPVAVQLPNPPPDAAPAAP
jgi:hypothetical protein